MLLADGVGVGKTFVALALAVLERAEGGDAVAVVPAALRAEWHRASRHAAVPLTLHTHTALARSAPALESRVSLVVVDEAHAFRNAGTRRYAALADITAGRRVALLTATPFNNAPGDLVALVRLFAGDDRFREFGVADLPAALQSGDAGAAALALAAISVCRSRRFVRARYPELDRVFPRRRLVPVAEYDLDATYGGALQPLLAALGRLCDGAPAPDRGAALLHLALLRRLESSAAALRRTLRRQRDYLMECEAASAHGRRITRREFATLFPRRDADEMQLSLLPLLLSPVATALPSDIAERRAALERALSLVEAVTGDPKLNALLALLAAELAGRRTIVFTEYRDTALYLARALRRRFRVLAVTGDAGWAGAARLSRRSALDAFAPIARGARADPLLAADLLVATDVASEGMNLQDAAAVVSYDLPWNPVRVMQRVGRVDRMGTRHAEAIAAHLLPAGGLRQLTGVLDALRRKLSAGPRGLGIEPDPLAALWWVGHPGPLPVALEAESWRRVEPFEAAERWRMILGSRPLPRRLPPLIAAGVVRGLDRPAAAVLLALEWPSGARIPLAYVVTGNGVIRTDAVALGDLALRALDAVALPTAPTDFSVVLASILPHARTQLLAASASRLGTGSASPNRRTAVRELVLAAHRAEEARDTAASAAIGRALDALRRDLPAGLDRRVGRLIRAGARGERLAAGILETVGRAPQTAGPELDGTPRLVLVAALALAAHCPSA